MEESLRNQLSRNEEEFKAQMDEFSKKQGKLNDIKKQRDNPNTKAVSELITVEPL